MNAGLQLWSLNGYYDNDIKKKLELTAQSGFKSVEFAGFGGLSADEMKSELEKNGLISVGSHSSKQIFEEQLEEELAYNSAIGSGYMIMPSAQFETMQDVDYVAELLNKAAAAAKKYGIKVGYHNHAHEFVKLEGEYILDLLMEKTLPEVVFEIDVYWVSYAGLDPYDYVASKGERVELIHMKQIGSDRENVMLPDGDIDFVRIRETAKFAKEFIVEQEGSVDKAVACRVNGEFVVKM